MIQVQRTRILTTSTTVYSAWEPSSYAGKHSTITTIDGQVYGRIGTERWESDLPVGQKRWDALDVFLDHRYEGAYKAIFEKHPELIGNPTMRMEMGEVTTTNEKD